MFRKDGSKRNFHLQASRNSEILKLRTILEDESRQKEKLEGEIAVLQSQLLQLSSDADEVHYFKNWCPCVRLCD